MRAAFLHQAASVAQGLRRINLVGHERQIHHHQRLGGAPTHHAAVAHHVLHGDRDGRSVTHHYHPQAVAYQE